MPGDGSIREERGWTLGRAIAVREKSFRWGSDSRDRRQERQKTGGRNKAPFTLPGFQSHSLTSTGSCQRRNAICRLQHKHDKAEYRKMHLELGNHHLIIYIKILIIQLFLECSTDVRLKVTWVDRGSNHSKNKFKLWKCQYIMIKYNI